MASKIYPITSEMITQQKNTINALKKPSLFSIIITIYFNVSFVFYFAAKDIQLQIIALCNNNYFKDSKKFNTLNICMRKYKQSIVNNHCFITLFRTMIILNFF
jgi:hypothetical protein